MRIDKQKRNIFRAAAAFAVWLGLRHTLKAGDEMTDTERRDKWEKERRHAEEQDALEVELLYSTKLVNFWMAGHEYRVPANYFTPKWEDDPTGTKISTGFGFFLFLPNFEGYSKTNWKVKFDKRLIQVLQVSPVDKEATAVYTDGTRSKVLPESYGDPKARFQNIRGLLEDKPTFHVYGLEGYRRKRGFEGGPITWTARRSNGEFFYFESTYWPNTAEKKPGRQNPLCRVQYYSPTEDLFIAYHYSQEHLGSWKEIDDQIWKKLHEWRVN
jgi:hypothetical protein